MKKRSTYIDCVKGILILLVVIGHILSGGVRENIFRYLIYSIHMPLFFGISGFMVNRSKMIASDAKTYITYCFKRFMFPWMIVVFIGFIYNYYSIIGHESFFTVFKYLIKDYVFPRYYLWFILAYFVYLWISRVILKYCGKKKWVVLFAVAAISFALVSYWRITKVNYTVYFVQKIRDFIYVCQMDDFIYFCFGMFMRYFFEKYDKKKDFPITCFIVISGFMFLLRLLMFYTEYPVAEEHSYFYLFLNLPLIVCLAYFYYCEIDVSNRLFQFMGENSLFIYLYHIVGKDVCSLLFVDGSWQNYVCNLFCFIILLFATWLGRKNKIISDVLMGLSSPKQ